VYDALIADTELNAPTCGQQPDSRESSQGNIDYHLLSPLDSYHKLNNLDLHNDEPLIVITWTFLGSASLDSRLERDSNGLLL
jgi:hypothetical protein